MSNNNEYWRASSVSEGSTASERYLVKLAKKAFLSLWSYPNIYTDEGRRGKGDGKELCDLLVVFGNDIILFSDKACEFTAHEDINVAWSRWYRRAVDKSAKQLKGAESWITRFPDKIFLDKKCESTLPIKLPSATEAHIHLVAVTRGSGKAAESYWGGGSSGSLFIDTKLTAEQHNKSPFRIGWPLPNKRFVHVFDETTLDIVLNELDTVSDFVKYLTKKEKLLCTEGMDSIISGEEELIAIYLSNFDYKKKEHYFPSIPKGALLALGEGSWKRLLDSPQYAARTKANAISYTWDNLIEFHSEYIISGSTLTLPDGDSVVKNERLMRILASESRLSRRSLGAAFHFVNDNKQKGMRLTRTIVSATEEGRAYVFMSLFQPEGFSFEEFMDMRRKELLLYAEGCKLKFENISEVVGIVFEPDKQVWSTVDFLLINFGTEKINKEFSNELQEEIKNANMWDIKALHSTFVRDLPFPEIKSPIIGIKAWLRHKLDKLGIGLK